MKRKLSPPPLRARSKHGSWGTNKIHYIGIPIVVVVVIFKLKAVPVSTQYFLTSVLVQLTRTPSVVTGKLPRKGTHIRKK